MSFDATLTDLKQALHAAFPNTKIDIERLLPSEVSLSLVYPYQDYDSASVRFDTGEKQFHMVFHNGLAIDVFVAMALNKRYDNALEEGLHDWLIRNSRGIY